MSLPYPRSFSISRFFANGLSGWNVNNQLQIARATIFVAAILAVVTIHAQAPVAFDVPAIVIAEPVNPAVVNQPTTGGDLYRLRIVASTYVSPQFRGTVRECVIELLSSRQTVRVLDFSPRNETYSEYEGSIKIDANRHQDEQFKFNIGATYPTVGSAAASGDFRRQLNVQESYQRKPTQQMLTSSGTIHQGFGVFFKFRPGPVDQLEGSKEIAVLVEVPRGWRADLLQVVMTAAGQESASGQQQIIQQNRSWITIHREGDAAAAAQAQAYVRHERHLRGLAASRHNEIEKRAYPTVWHKAGAALRVVDSRIPPDYLQRVLFGRDNPNFNDGSQRLPVDLRVAILDYWQHREQLFALASAANSKEASSTNSALAVASIN